MKEHFLDPDIDLNHLKKLVLTGLQRSLRLWGDNILKYMTIWPILRRRLEKYLNQTNFDKETEKVRKSGEV